MLGELLVQVVVPLSEGWPPRATCYDLIQSIRYYYDSGSLFLLPQVASRPRHTFRSARTLRTGRYRSADSRPRPTLGQSVTEIDTAHRPPPRDPRRARPTNRSPQGRNDDHRRHGDVRLRPNRPGPSRTERGLEIDGMRESPNFVSLPMQRGSPGEVRFRVAAI